MSADHIADPARKWEGRMLACLCGYRCLQDEDMRQHLADPERDTFRLPTVYPDPPRQVFRRPTAPKGHTAFWHRHRGEAA